MLSNLLSHATRSEMAALDAWLATQPARTPVPDEVLAACARRRFRRALPLAALVGVALGAFALTLAQVVGL